VSNKKIFVPETQPRRTRRNTKKKIKTDELEWYDERFKFGKPDSEMDIMIPLK